MNKGQYQLFTLIIILTSVITSIGILYHYSFKPKIETSQTTTTATMSTTEATTSISSPTTHTTTSIYTTQSYTTSTILPTTSTTIATSTYTEYQTSSLIADELSQSISNITIGDIWNAINS